MRSLSLSRPASEASNGIIIITIMLVAILEVLDSTIVNVALPKMMATLGANSDQITWVLTSYVVASAMMLPLTGFLNQRFGQRYFLLVCISGFMVSSFLCGFSTSLTEMVIFRLMQGMFGASLIPLSQAILRQSFPLEKQGNAMAIWGIGIMSAPVFGPTLGGWITEHASWQWIFYINVPVCLVALTLTFLFIKQTERILQKIDWPGILMMFIGIGALQIFLDKGNSSNWFDSNFILLLAILSGLFILLFIYRSLTQPKPAVKLAIFQDRNFALSSLMLALFAGSVFAAITLEPILLESLFNYPAVTAGMTMGPSGIASAIAMIISSQLMTRINVKYLLIVAVFCSAFGILHLSTLSLSATEMNFVVANAFFGFGMGLFMVPLTTYSLVTIKKNEITEAAGLFSYSRMLGTSIGISLFSTFVARQTQANWNILGGSINVYNPNLNLWLQHMKLTLSNPVSSQILGLELHRQSMMLAFNYAFQTIALVLLLLIPCILLLKRLDLKSPH